MNTALHNKSILLVISGGIAAYKSLELIRLIKKAGGSVRAVLTAGGAQFVTPLSVSALCEEEVYTDLWSLKDESEMGHIRLSREADAIVIAPATADIMAKMAHGLTPDLATTTLLASDKPALIAPAMNHKMWDNPATQANIETLKAYGHTMIGPDEGSMACGEEGMGRMSEPDTIFSALLTQLSNTKKKPKNRPLKGRKALVTSGPTYEAIDPVRFIGNHSSGKQGHAIANALAEAGAKVTLITGPVSLSDPAGVNTIHITSATEMLNACEDTLKNNKAVDIAICAAAVADWAVKNPSSIKIKKSKAGTPPALEFAENPDILKTLSNHKNRPALVIGFAAETNNVIENATAKIQKKSCDWILANDVSKEVFGAEDNKITFIDGENNEKWPHASKNDVAEMLVDKIISHLQ